ncbi:beta-propeller fold lactonase family protein [Clostridium sp. MCC353]|uniref:lactonase family protein n=1 Tax=Clostridium sp. MCC353 TaxID=2592646 RepID=UPI001C02683F|nr:beta-propeller fold lactonase family protein [Clostridium sp. MCC353]
MENKMYAVIGGWGFRGGIRGLSTYEYDPRTSELSCLDSGYEDIAVGSQFYEKERGILYFTDERKDQRGQTGGGGYVCAAKISPEDGTLHMIGERPSLLTNPSYVWPDRSGRYALVSHHVTDSYITKLVQNEDGTYGAETVYEKAALMLFRVNEDGSLGQACDVYEAPVQRGDHLHPFSHLHCVIADPGGETYIVCDKGLDMLYSFRIDREKGKLIPCGSFKAEDGSHPRYGVFHPELPFFYGNHEEAAYVSRYLVDRETAEITCISTCGILENEENGDMKPAPSDIVISRDGKFLYVSIRGINRIGVIALSETGKMELIQNISCGGDNPRGLCLSPDGKYLYVCNVNSNQAVSFTVKPDGRLEASGIVVNVSRPGNMSIFKAGEGGGKV